MSKEGQCYSWTMFIMAVEIKAEIIRLTVTKLVD